MSGILVVEDDAGFRAVVAAAFRRAGFLVRTAADEEEALEAFETYKPAAVIADLVLPAGEGLRTIRTMNDARPSAPIVVMSGGGMFASDDLLSMAKAMGASATLTKPFDMRDAIRLVSDLVAPPLQHLAV